MNTIHAFLTMRRGEAHGLFDQWAANSLLPPPASPPRWWQKEEVMGEQEDILELVQENLQGP